MTATRRRSSNSGDPGPLGGGSTFRGALLIGAAVIVGVVLLGKGFESGAVSSDSSTPAEEEAANDQNGGGDDGETTSTSSATPTTHAAAEVRVIVLNAGGPSGSAATTRTTLAAAGFTTVPEGNSDPGVAASVVYYTPGFEADAAAVGAAVGITAAPQPMPATPPQNVPAGEVDVAVMLGPDFTPPA
jgi:hypothetical protein